jgi:hypothetical protein
MAATLEVAMCRLSTLIQKFEALQFRIDQRPLGLRVQSFLQPRANH